MRVLILGGTKAVGPAATRHLREAHTVAVAHSGTHEHADVADLEHLHGSREELLADGGPVERWRPEVLVDTFAGGATAERARQLAEVATRSDSAHLIAISSIDVYQHGVDSGMADGTGSRALSRTPLPVVEDAPLRSAPYPGGSAAHDNVAAEAALHGCGKVTALRPGAIYGPHVGVRERTFVELIAAGVHELPLPDGGTQLFHRVATDRVGRAIAASVDRAPDGFWACNVVDPYDWDYSGLANEIGRVLDWHWEPIRVAFADTDHPWQVTHPFLCSDRRLRDVLQVDEPDPQIALAECLEWQQADVSRATRG